MILPEIFSSSSYSENGTGDEVGLNLPLWLISRDMQSMSFKAVSLKLWLAS